jgi:hypothetical protein
VRKHGGSEVSKYEEEKLGGEEGKFETRCRLIRKLSWSRLIESGTVTADREEGRGKREEGRGKREEGWEEGGGFFELDWGWDWDWHWHWHWHWHEGGGAVTLDVFIKVGRRMGVEGWECAVRDSYKSRESEGKRCR